MRRWGAIACAIWCVFAAALIGLRVQAGSAFDTDIQSLLPQNALEPIIREAMEKAGAVASSRVEILVSADAPERAAEAAAALEHDLKAAGLFTADQDQGGQIGAWLYANRNALICEARASDFNGDAARASALAMLYAPGAPISAQMLTHDPFLRTLMLAQCLTPRGMGAAAQNGVLVSGRLIDSAYRLDVQERVVSIYDAWRARFPDARADRAGALFYAADSAGKVQGEISLIGTLSLVIVIGCLVVTFRRTSAVVGTMAVTAAGAIGSLGAALLVFPSVHVLVLVFGSALIGVTSDYAVHYLATGPTTKWAPVEERLKLVFRPLLVCASATSLGFASLMLFDVSLFNQVAVFSIAGIATALWFTFTLLPMMDRKPKDPERYAAWWDKLEAPFGKMRWPRWAAILGLVALAGVCVIAVLRFHVLDDVRRFQPLSPVLRAEEQNVREATGFGASPRFLVSYGANPDDARAHEEAALAALPNDARGGILASSRLNPSDQRRAENEQVIRERLYAPHLAAWSAMLGNTPDPFSFGAGSYAASAPFRFQRPRWDAIFRGRAAWRSAELDAAPATEPMSFWSIPPTATAQPSPPIGAMRSSRSCWRLRSAPWLWFCFTGRRALSRS